MNREKIDTGGYRFEDAGGKSRGVWTPAERARESLRRSAAQAEAATAALAQTEQRIAEIRADASKTDQEKLQALRRLTASGYSDEEFAVLRAAQENG